MLRHKRIESYLPVFPGFYGSLFECNCEDQVIESPYKYDDYDFDYTDYNVRVSKGCVDAIERKLKELGMDITITYQSISSPREYNFRNDSINVAYKLNDIAIKAINSYLIKNQNEFEFYLHEHFTSCSGFISFWSNNVETWFNEYLPKKDKAEFCLGAVLDFILQNEDYNTESLYYDVEDCNYIDGTLKEGRNTKDATDFAIEYTRANYMAKGIEDLTKEILHTCEDNEFVTFDLIKGVVIETITAIENKTLQIKF